MNCNLSIIELYQSIRLPAVFLQLPHDLIVIQLRISSILTHKLRSMIYIISVVSQWCTPAYKPIK